MCPRQSDLKFEQQHVPADVLAAVLDAAPKLSYVGFQGIGEPLLHPNLPDIVKSFRDRLPAHGRLGLTTNGTLLTRDLAARLFDAGLNAVTFSIDGASCSVYEARRVGAHFERLCENVATATALARDTGRTDLWLGANMVVAPDNLAEVPEFVRLVSRLGMSTAAFFRGRNYPSMQIMDLDPDTWPRMKDDAMLLGRELGVAVHFAKPRSGPLPECPFMCGVYLWLTGEVAPCHRMEPPGKPWPTRLFGNVRKTPLLELWEAPEFRAYRNGVLSGELPEECRDCTFPDSVSTGG
jgi:MoaA/NifB/PqqE/SkfB family radical SAM enzyme